MTREELLATLPPPPDPRGKYQPVVLHNGIAYVSGQTSRRGGEVVSGMLARDDDLSEAQEAARIAARRCISALIHAAGGIDKVVRILSLRGFVNADNSFTRHPVVIDAASQVMLDFFGSNGEHARIAVGAGSIPGGALVEVELVAAVET